jgi:phosphoglycolate phosphatase-like HAD superfamily hydrolase
MIINLTHRCPPTIFSDIDGTMWKHEYDIRHSMNGTQRLLPGVFDKFLEWHRQGFKIILTTGRPEALREETERQLRELGIFYNQLVMDCGPGPRILINDMESTAEDIKFKAKAQAVNLIRDSGMENLEILYTQEKDE